VSALAQVPQLDGQDSDRGQVPEFKVNLTPIQPDSKLESRPILIKAGHFQEQLFFYASWPDDQEDLIHKPYLWDDTKQRYVMGKAKEDRFTMQFEMSGEHSTDWANA
jgi:hypothetical protein